MGLGDSIAASLLLVYWYRYCGRGERVNNMAEEKLNTISSVQKRHI